jgi:phosphoadenosine phosphosulfate reductase
LINEALIAELDKIGEPGPLLAELNRCFPGRMAIGTSGQLTGCALIDLAVKAKVKPRVFTVDTLRLFSETYDLFEALKKKYRIVIENFQPDPNALDAMVKEHGEYLFFDSKEKQEHCCRIRKVLPHEKALDTLDVWITGLRADQSKARANTGRFQIIQHNDRPILKVAPLAAWTEAQVREYLKANQVPVHKLLETTLPGGWYYESLGCILCTTPIGPNEPRRAGRWRWFNAQDSSKECGIHLPDRQAGRPAADKP